MPNYVQLADSLAADIAAHRLRPGDRLLPQREFAWRNGVAVSTAGRVYGELLRRGLVVGEVGRGTFVAAQAERRALSLVEPSRLSVDLALNQPVLAEQAPLLAQSLAPLMRPDVLGGTLAAPSAGGSEVARRIAAGFLSTGQWRPDPATILFAGSGKQAIAASIAALVPPGGRLGVEAITYPVVTPLAARLGIVAVPLPLDGDGVRPGDLARIHADARLSALYLQPVLHNPLGTTMPPARCAAIARFAESESVPVIEDRIYAFLADDPPLATRARADCVVVDSLSKRVAPGMSVGIIAAPPGSAERFAEAVRSGGWLASGLQLEAAVRLMADGTAARIGAAKRDDARARQVIARKALDGFAVRADPRAYHLWLELPEGWRSELLTAIAARHGIALAPSRAFTAGEGQAPAAVRIALASPSPDGLRRALETLGRLLRAGPDSHDCDWTE